MLLTGSTAAFWYARAGVLLLAASAPEPQGEPTHDPFCWVTAREVVVRDDGRNVGTLRFGDSLTVTATKRDLAQVVRHRWGKPELKGWIPVTAVGGGLGVADVFAEAVKKDPNDARAKLALGEIYILCGRSTGEWQYGLTLVDEALDLEAELVEGYAARATLHMRQHRWKEAIEDLSAVLASCPGDPWALEWRAQSYLEAGKPLGRQPLSEQNLRRAIADYTERMGLAPPNPDGFYYRAECRFHLGEFDAAIADLRKSKELGARVGWADRLIAEISLRRGQYRAAIEKANKELESSPDDPQMCLVRARANVALGNYAAAKSDFQNAVPLLPTDDDEAAACADYAWLLATCPADDVRDGRLALQMGKKACWKGAMEDDSEVRWPRNSLARAAGGFDCAWLRCGWWFHWRRLDVLAAAYAECGDFPSAIRCEEAAIQSASEETKPALLSRLDLYKQKKAFRADGLNPLFHRPLLCKAEGRAFCPSPNLTCSTAAHSQRRCRGAVLSKGPKCRVVAPFHERTRRLP
jgi:tetratricopeptide (TPR) repeat protein